MMPESLLSTLAEVAVAMTALSGIVVVLLGRDDIAWIQTEVSAVKAMLETGLTVVLFSLLALSLVLFSDGSHYGLRSLLVAFALWHFVILIQLAAAILGASSYLWVVFVLGLIWLILMSAINFCMLLYSWLDSTRDRGDSTGGT